MTDLVAPSRPIPSDDAPRREARPWRPGRFLLIVFVSAMVEAVLIAGLLAFWAYRDFDGFHAAMRIVIGLILDLADALPG